MTPTKIVLQIGHPKLHSEKRDFGLPPIEFYSLQAEIAVEIDGKVQAGASSDQIPKKLIDLAAEDKPLATWRVHAGAKLAAALVLSALAHLESEGEEEECPSTTG